MFNANEFIDEIINENDAENEENAPIELTETLGAMLPQIPLSESTIEFINDPSIEWNDYYSEGFLSDIGQGITKTGFKINASGKSKVLAMKIAVTKKRIKNAKKSKMYERYVPQLEEELAHYERELEIIKDSLNDIDKEKLEAVQSISECMVNDNIMLKDNITSMDINVTESVTEYYSEKESYFMQVLEDTKEAINKVNMELESGNDVLKNKNKLNMLNSKITLIEKVLDDGESGTSSSSSSEYTYKAVSGPDGYKVLDDHFSTTKVNKIGDWKSAFTSERDGKIDPEGKSCGVVYYKDKPVAVKVSKDDDSEDDDFFKLFDDEDNFDEDEINKLFKDNELKSDKIEEPKDEEDTKKEENEEEIKETAEYLNYLRNDLRERRSKGEINQMEYMESVMDLRRREKSGSLEEEFNEIFESVNEYESTSYEPEIDLEMYIEKVHSSWFPETHASLLD